MNVGDFVVVRWLDTVTVNDWYTEEQALAVRPAEIKTSGWIMVKNKEIITLTAMTGDYHTLLACIPTRSVISIRRIKGCI